MKRTLTLVLAVLLAMSMMFAASADDLEMSDVANMTAPGVLPIVVEPTDLTIATAQNALVTDYDDNYLTKYVEEQTGIHVVWDLLPGAETGTVLDLRLASGETLPDIIAYNFGGSTASYGDQGYFIDLTGWHEKYGYFFWNDAPGMEQSDYDEYFNRSKEADGAMYSYSFYTKALGDRQKDCIYINMQWLNKLGLEKPTNLDELYDVLVAFRDNDMNGNGDTADEFPMIGSLGAWNGYFQEQIINNFVYYNQDYMLDVEDDKVFAPFVTEEWQNAMIYLNKLCTEGLLAPVSFTMTREEYAQMLEAQTLEEQICGVIVGSTAHIRVDKSNPYLLSYDYLDPFEGQYTAERTANVTKWGHITCDCQIPEIAFRYMDFFAQEKVSVWTRYGAPVSIMGEEANMMWRADDPEAFDALYPNPGQTAMIVGFDAKYGTNPNGGAKDPWSNENNQIYNAHWFCLLPGATYGASGTKTPADEFCNDWQSSWDAGDVSAHDGYVNAYLKHHLSILPDQVFVDPVYTLEELDQYNDTISTVQTYVKECIAGFATGAMDPVNDWDNYVAQCDAAGLQDWLKIAQDYWDRK